MADAYVIAATILVIIIGAILGSVFLALIPYWRKNKTREEEYHALQEIMPDKLTPEEKYKMEKFEKGVTLPFLKMYKHTLLIGVTFGFMIAMTSYSGILGNMPEDAGVEAIIPAFFTALGLSGFGTALSNEGIKTK